MCCIMEGELLYIKWKPLVIFQQGKIISHPVLPTEFHTYVAICITQNFLNRIFLT